MTTFNTIPTKDTDTSEPNWALSMAAAIPSGIIKTFEGAATFGAALFALLAAFCWGSSTVIGKHALIYFPFSLVTALRLIITTITGIVIIIFSD